ncbi:MAG: glycosyltransferase [Solirubrobacteraceae bacterium]
MIAFGSSITNPVMYDKACGPGIALAKEQDSVVLARAAAGSIYESYNLIIEQAAKLDDLEALVLLHQDSEIVDPDFCAKVREAIADPEVGVVGCAGAVGVRSIAWWHGSVTWAAFIHRYEEFGGGDLPAFGWDGEPKPAYAELGEVDSVDGFVLVLSPWVVRNLRFDESLGMLHGYDFDFCLTVREAGKKIVTANLQVVHHHGLDLVSNPDTWAAAHIAVAEKWEGRMPGVGEGGGDWKQRARQAEAQLAVYRTLHRAEELKREAAVNEIERSLSWRITRPLRVANLLRRTFRTAGKAR